MRVMFIWKHDTSLNICYFFAIFFFVVTQKINSINLLCVGGDLVIIILYMHIVYIQYSLLINKADISVIIMFIHKKEKKIWIILWVGFCPRS